MINFASKLRLHSPVVAVGECKDGLIFVDSGYRIYKTSKNAREFTFIKQVLKETEPLHEYTKAVDCNDNHILMPKADSRIDTLYGIEQGKLSVLKRLAWQKGYITASKISHDLRYIATGGEDGRCYVYSNHNYNLHSILPPCPDYISCIVFCDNSKLICYCSYKPQIVICDLESEKILANFEISSVAEDCAFFDNDTKLFFVCRNGDTGVYDIQTRKKDIKHNYDVWLSAVTLNFDKNYAYIGARNNIFYLHRLDSNAPIQNFELEVNGVNALKRLSDKVYFCCVDGSVLILDAAKHLSEFLEICKNGNFTTIYNFVHEKNILLKTLKIYENIRTKMWPDVLKEAVDDLQKGDLKKAINSVSMFVEDPKLDLEFKNFIKNQALINESIECVRNKQYKRLYEIAMDFEQLKQLSFFKNLEAEFNKLYELAKIIIVKDPEYNVDKAKVILGPFLEVESKKQLIDAILVNSDKFAMAERYIKEKNLKDFFELCQKYSFIKDTKSYQVAYQTCSKLFNRALNEVFKMDNTGVQEQAQSDCIRILNYLKEMEPFKEQALELLNLADLKKKFLEILKVKDYKKCYDFIDNHKELYNLQEVIHLDDSINNLLSKCIERAYDGEPYEVYRAMKPLFDIEKWHNRTYSIMKISFLYELEKAKQKRYDEVNWKDTFCNYISLFGRDNEIRLFCNDSNLKETLNLIDQDKQVSTQMLSSIVVCKHNKVIKNDMHEL